MLGFRRVPSFDFSMDRGESSFLGFGEEERNEREGNIGVSRGRGFF